MTLYAVKSSHNYDTKDTSFWSEARCSKLIALPINRSESAIVVAVMANSSSSVRPAFSNRAKTFYTDVVRLLQIFIDKKPENSSSRIDMRLYSVGEFYRFQPIDNG